MPPKQRQRRSVLTGADPSIVKTVQLEGSTGRPIRLLVDVMECIQTLKDRMISMAT